jgi:hypothetical protein
MTGFVVKYFEPVPFEKAGGGFTPAVARTAKPKNPTKAVARTAKPLKLAHSGGYPPA